MAVFCALLPAFGWAQNPLPRSATSNVVCWQEGRTLDEEDFQAKNRPILPEADSLPGTFLGATTEANAVVYDFVKSTGQKGVMVRVEFYKAKSWMNKTADMDISYTVAHEQLHFDIVELTGRKIRRLLATYAARKKSLSGPEITAEIVCTYEEEDSLQAMYDEDTYAGNDLFQQGRWTALVGRSLKQLAKYKSTAADCIQP
jgi:hypothetical protein